MSEQATTAEPMTYQQAHAVVTEWETKITQLEQAIEQGRAALGVATLSGNGAKATKDLRNLQDQLESAQAALPVAIEYRKAAQINDEYKQISAELAQAEHCEAEADKCAEVLKETEPIVIQARDQLQWLLHRAHLLRTSVEKKQARLRSIENAPLHAAEDIKRRNTIAVLFNGRNGGMRDVVPSVEDQAQ